MLTKSQQKVYDYLKSRAQDGLPPTVREICQATGLKSTSSVHAHLKTLEREGYIVRDAGLNRAIHIVGEKTYGCTVTDFRANSTLPKNTEVVLNVHRERFVQLLKDCVKQYSK